jgi:U3 small nucleolar RNA-associated protein MPP10
MGKKSKANVKKLDRLTSSVTTGNALDFMHGAQQAQPADQTPSESLRGGLAAMFKLASTFKQYRFATNRVMTQPKHSEEQVWGQLAVLYAPVLKQLGEQVTAAQTLPARQKAAANGKKAPAKRGRVAFEDDGEDDEEAEEDDEEYDDEDSDDSSLGGGLMDDEHVADLKKRMPSSSKKADVYAFGREGVDEDENDADFDDDERAMLEQEAEKMAKTGGADFAEADGIGSDEEDDEAFDDDFGGDDFDDEDDEAPAGKKGGKKGKKSMAEMMEDDGGDAAFGNENELFEGEEFEEEDEEDEAAMREMYGGADVEEGEDEDEEMEDFSGSDDDVIGDGEEGEEYEEGEDYGSDDEGFDVDENGVPVAPSGKKSKPRKVNFEKRHGDDDYTGGDAEGDDEDEDDEDPNLTAFERAEKRRMRQIRGVEQERLLGNSWQMSGEVAGAVRPKDSLLDTALDFEHALPPVPVISEAYTSKLEDRLKKRILDGHYNDVERRVLKTSADDLVTSKRDAGIDATKSKQSLMDLYEKDYMDKQRKAEGGPEVAEPLTEVERDELKALQMWKRLSQHLDALSNFHFTPKPINAEVDARVRANKEQAPAITLEAVGMTALAKDAVLAPQDVHRPKFRALDGVSTEEMTVGERQRVRRAKKASSSETKERIEKFAAASKAIKDKERQVKLDDKMAAAAKKARK